MPIEPRLTVQSTLGPECDITVTPWREDPDTDDVEINQCDSSLLMDRETAFELIRAIKVYFDIKDANGKE